MDSIITYSTCTQHASNFFQFKMRISLAGVAQWIGCRPANQRVTGLIPSQGTYLGCKPDSPVGGMQEATTHWCFSFPSPLSKNKIFKKNKFF